MQEKSTLEAHKKCIDDLIDYMLKHINEDLSLKKLAEKTHYSPFYLQKLFKQLIGESPKQYVVKIRLESALLMMIIHPYKPIKEISTDCGFTSPAVFSRAVKNYFGLSPEELRQQSPHERMGLPNRRQPHHQRRHIIGANVDLEPFSIQLKHVGEITGAYIRAPFNNMQEISKAFRSLSRMATANELDMMPLRFYGVISPHQGIEYKSFMAVFDPQLLPRKCTRTTIAAGKYVAFKLTGDYRATIAASHRVFHEWLPQNGLKLAGIIGFETFNGDPSFTPYEQLEREVFLPVEPI